MQIYNSDWFQLLKIDEWYKNTIKKSSQPLFLNNSFYSAIICISLIK